MNYKKILQQDVLPFWLKNGLDNRYGGIFTLLDRYGNVYGTEKSVWFQGRALWTFSKAYNVIEKKLEYLEAAKNIYSFLPNCTDVDGRMFFIVTQDGKPVQKRRYFFSEAFAAIGCAEYFKMTSDEDAWAKAEGYFDIMYEVYQNPIASVPKFNLNTRPLKSLSPVMILLATAQVMRSVGRNREKYDALVTEAISEIINCGFLNMQIGALLESVCLNEAFSDTPTGRVVNPGHSLEAAWFILAEGLLRNDSELMQMGKYIIDITMPLGWDEKYGGILSFIDVKGLPPQQLEWDMKLWWPHNEAIIANVLAYYQFKDRKYQDNFKQLNKYAFTHFYDKDCGEWYGYLHYDGTVANKLKGNIFKGPFHLPRMLMLLSCLETGNVRAFLE